MSLESCSMRILNPTVFSEAWSLGMSKRGATRGGAIEYTRVIKNRFPLAPSPVCFIEYLLQYGRIA